MTDRHEPTAWDQALALVDTFRPALLVVLGKAGSGKTTLIRRAWPDDVVVSLDALRGELAGDSGFQAMNPEVVAEGYARIESRTTRGLHTIFDSTNTTTERRLATLAVAGTLPAVAVLVDQPLDVCLARQHTRRPTRRVPVPEIERMHTELASATPVQLLGEGFTAALVVQAASDTYTVEIHQR